MTLSDTLQSAQTYPTAGGHAAAPTLGVLAIDFIDVNRSVTLAAQIANLALLWARESSPTGLCTVLTAGKPSSSLEAIAGEIDRLLLDCQSLLPRLADIVDRYADHLSPGPILTGGTRTLEARAAGTVTGVVIHVDGTPVDLRPVAARMYNSDIAVAAADLASRAIVEAEARRRQVWEAFGSIARGETPSPVWRKGGHFVILSFGTAMLLPAWLADSAQATVAWLTRQLSAPTPASRPSI